MGVKTGSKMVLTMSEFSDIIRELKVNKFDTPSNDSVCQAVLSHLKLEE